MAPNPCNYCTHDHRGRLRPRCNQYDRKCKNYISGLQDVDDDDEVPADLIGGGVNRNVPGQPLLPGTGQGHSLSLVQPGPPQQGGAPRALVPLGSMGSAQWLSKSGSAAQQSISMPIPGTEKQAREARKQLKAQNPAPSNRSTGSPFTSTLWANPQAPAPPGSELEPMQFGQSSQGSAGQKRRAATPPDQPAGQPIPPAQIIGHIPTQQRPAQYTAADQMLTQGYSQQPQQRRRMTDEEFHRFVPNLEPDDDTYNLIAGNYSPETRAKRDEDRRRAGYPVNMRDEGRLPSGQGHRPVGSMQDPPTRRSGLRRRNLDGTAMTSSRDDRSPPDSPAQSGGATGSQMSRKDAKVAKNQRRGGPSPRGGPSRNIDRGGNNLGARYSESGFDKSTPKDGLTELMRVNSLDDDMTPLSLDSSSNSGVMSSNDSTNTRTTRGSAKKKRKDKVSGGNGLLKP